MLPTHHYDVSVEWQSGRHGLLRSSVLNEPITVATPPEFNKGEAGIWSPEHLLVAAVNGCLMTTFLAIADNSRLPFSSFRSDADGTLETVDGVYQISRITLRPEVVIEDEGLREKTLSLLKKSEAACLISNSVHAKITFEPSVLVKQPA